MIFVRGIHPSPVNSPHIGTVTRKMIPFDDVTMASDNAAVVAFFAVQAMPCIAMSRSCRNQNYESAY